MSWIERSVEERLAQAVRDGELDPGPLAGTKLPDLDRQRGQGWWAERFVKRELSHDRRVRAEADAARARVGFWTAGSVEEVVSLVGDANDAIAAANINLVDSDRLDPFDADDIIDRWRRLRRP